MLIRIFFKKSIKIITFARQFKKITVIIFITYETFSV